MATPYHKANMLAVLDVGIRTFMTANVPGAACPYVWLAPPFDLVAS